MFFIFQMNKKRSNLGYINKRRRKLNNSSKNIFTQEKKIYKEHTLKANKQANKIIENKQNERRNKLI
jgi:hypothetical protein